MKYSLIFCHFFCVIILYNCTNHKSSESINRLYHQTIDISEDYIGYGGFLTIIQDTIVGIDFSPSMQPLFCLKQNRASQTLFHFGHKGQGPDDFLMPYSIQHINGQIIGIWDIMLRTFFEFSIPNENEKLILDKRIMIEARLSRVIKTAFNQYVGLSFDEGMLLLTDSTGMTINSFFEYPFQDNDDRQITSRANAYQGTLVTNSSKNKLVYSSYHGEIIHFYNIENNDIKVISKIENAYPLYKNRLGEEEGVMYGSNGKLGYIATYATDKYVYAIYSGKTLIEQGISVNFEGRILRVFDWCGSLVKEYELDIPCGYLCVSEDDSKMWAIASNPDITMVTFDLDKTTEKKQFDEQNNGSPIEELKENQNLTDSQLIKQQEFLNSFPANVDVKMINGSLHINPKTDKQKIDIKKDTLPDKSIRYQLQYQDKK